MEGKDLAAKSVRRHQRLVEEPKIEEVKTGLA
jgi:hypothetical protein